MPVTVADWPAVRATWVACGSFSLAAQAHGLDSAAVRMRAKREGWKAEHAEIAERVTRVTDGAVTIQKAGEKALRSVTGSAEATEIMLRKLADKGRIGAAKYVARVLPHAARMARSDPDRALGEAPNVKAAASVGASARLPGWVDETERAGAVVNIALLGVPPA